MKNTIKILIGFIFTSSLAYANDYKEKEINKFVTDYLSKMFIVVKPINIKGDKIKYDAIISHKKCTIDIVMTELQNGTKKMLVNKIDCESLGK
ncbi:hypothetical protein [Xenorhabdus bovienii]|uniref:hypothetical protein n=1 Tax=Xenorhabdus bovienii TaxID=40576 RepID=UPI0023B289C3|nr:hypothetical protein [Xenorhabdus bovienii]MDE9544154.1 hypothetical protein [Xenorhabdus bovienii]